MRQSWDEYFLSIMNAVAQRATCDRGRSGCVITRNRRILVTGYVGSLPNMPHCDEDGHDLRKVLHTDGTASEHCMRTIHAEQNAICEAARRGVALEAATLYCRMTPCRVCAMLLISAGIKRVVCERKYHAGGESEQLFHKAGVWLEILHDEEQSY